MSVTIDRAKQFRQHAKECRALAEQAWDKKVSEQFIDLARRWERMASSIDRAEQSWHAETPRLVTAH